ncbi:MAG TPA: S41 family peptidase [Bacillota bacterium]
MISRFFVKRLSVKKGAKVVTETGRKRLVGVVLLLFFLVFFFGFGIGITQGRYQDLGLALQIIPYVKFNYYKPVSLLHLLAVYMQKGNIQDLLASLDDPYTRYLSPEQYAELMSETEGSYGGVGLYLEYKEDQLIIMRPMKGTPAEEAGLRQGDEIIAINAEPTKEMAQEVAVAKVRGPSGTKVKLTIKRRNNLFDVELVRTVIKIPTVEWQVKSDPVAGKIGWIELFQFNENTAADLEKALAYFNEEKVAGLVLDLRYNPGGLLNAAVQVASKFVRDGPIVHVNPRAGREMVYPALPYEGPEFPLVVLVNEWSASASEIVAGAIKDRDVGTLVGATTFGKGVVQDVIPLWGGGALTLTVANYLTAGGNFIHEKGITPDVLVGTAEEKEALLRKYTDDIDGDRQSKEEAYREIQKIDEKQNEKALEVLRERILRVSWQEKEAA